MSTEEKIIMRKGRTLQKIAGWERCTGCGCKVEVVESRKQKRTAVMINHKLRSRDPCPGSGTKFKHVEDKSTFNIHGGSSFWLPGCDGLLRSMLGFEKNADPLKGSDIWETHFPEILEKAAQLGVPFVIQNGTPKNDRFMFCVADDPENARWVVVSGDRFKLQVALAIGAYVERNYRYTAEENWVRRG